MTPMDGMDRILDLGMGFWHGWTGWMGYWIWGLGRWGLVDRLIGAGYSVGER